MPDNTAAVQGKSSTGTSTTPVGPALSVHDSMAAEPTKLPVETQQANVTPEEAYKALNVTIGNCKRQPKGYLAIKEGVLLGKFEQRLTYNAIADC